MRDLRVQSHAFRESRAGSGVPKRLIAGAALASEKVPRVARLLALAHKFQRMLDSGEVRSMAELARLGGVSRARITQIMNLLMLAPQIQEELLLLPAVGRSTKRPSSASSTATTDMRRSGTGARPPPRICGACGRSPRRSHRRRTSRRADTVRLANAFG